MLGATASVHPSYQAEIKIREQLFLIGDDEVGRDFIHAPRLQFSIEGIDGKHQCLVYDLYGLGVSHAVWPINMVKRLAKDSLQALEFLHRKEVCHASTSSELFSTH